MKKHFALFALMASFMIGHAQTDTPKYSDPYAPVGSEKLTVPDCVRPILNVWMRDTYITYGSDGYFYMVGTTATPNRKFTGQVHCWDYNDGYYMWKSKDMMKWEDLGLIWSYEKDATWQKVGKPIKPGAKSPNNDPLDSIYRAAWAPELHYVKSKKQWLLIGCQNGGAGSFILKSTSGLPQGPYVNIEGNSKGPIFKNIDLSLTEDDNGDVYLVAHNHYIAKMKSDLSGLEEDYKSLIETPYNPEPYIEGVNVVKYQGKYHLMQTVWSIVKPDGTYTYSYPGEKVTNNERHSYDVVVSTADNIYGPYGPRYPAIIEGGHNNLFQDAKGKWWSTTFFNPRGIMGTKFPVTCRPAVVAIKWEKGKMMPDIKRTEAFYKKLPK